MSQHPAAPAVASPIDASAWTPAQAMRLDAEWRDLQRAFAYHPFVEVVPLSGDPPAEFQVNYKVTTLVIDEQGQLVYMSTCPVHLWLPPHFPHTAPVVRPMAAAFHPNVTTEWIHLNPAWGPNRSLVEVISQVGFLLAFQSYDPNAVANPVAMNWVHANPQLLPTDATADFSPAAGGGPVVRIMRFGLSTLRGLQERVEALCERTVTSSPAPGREEIEQLWHEVRLTLSLFLAPDVPEHLRAAAAELGDLASSLREPDSLWSQIARQVATCNRVGVAAGEVMKAEETLRRVLAAEATPPRHHSAAGDVPPPSIVQPSALALRRAVKESEQALLDLREGLAQLAAAPRVPAAAAPPGTVMARRLARELAHLSAASEPARAAGASLASLEPVLERARAESSAADRVVAWAEHSELLRRGRELVDRIKSTGPANLQAYRVETTAGTTGPFDFEQPVDSGAGGAPIAVWNMRAALCRVIGTEFEEVIARGDGRIALPPRTDSATAGAATLVVAEHTDEVRVQLEYLLMHSRDALARLRVDEDEQPPLDGRSTWAAGLAAELDQPDHQQRAMDEHRRAADVWKHMLAELPALGLFKQRLATFHLVNRLIDFAGRVRSERERLTAVVTRADSHLADIGARSGRDADTDGLIIPVQYASEYAQYLNEREQAQHQLRRLETALDAGTERLRVRLTKPRLYGSSDLPQLRLLGPVPRSYVEQRPHVSDEAVQRLVQRLEELLGTSIRHERTQPEASDAH